jgi:hypothetical protein
MPTKTAVEKMHHLLADLQHCVAALESTHGDSPAMRRIVNDAHMIRNGIHRLEIDLEELGPTSALVPCAGPADMIQISDTDYDASFGQDVDHEGVGAQSLAGAHVTQRRG